MAKFLDINSMQFTNKLGTENFVWLSKVILLFI